jgi:hypothetical protein
MTPWGGRSERNIGCIIALCGGRPLDPRKLIGALKPPASRKPIPLFEAALNACKHRHDAERYQHTKRRLGRQRGPKVAQIELARKLTEAIRHMLTNNQPFAPAGAPFRLAA